MKAIRLCNKTVRYRTVGDMTCTAAVESTASTIDDIINEIIATRPVNAGKQELMTDF